MSQRRRIITCTGCLRDRPHCGNGLCRSCWSRGRPRYDAPTGNPNARVPRASEAVAGRIEDYELLTRVRKLKRRDAAAQLGISYRTASRYEARLEAAAR